MGAQWSALLIMNKQNQKEQKNITTEFFGNTHSLTQVSQLNNSKPKTDEWGEKICSTFNNICVCMYSEIMNAFNTCTLAHIEYALVCARTQNLPAAKWTERPHTQIIMGGWLQSVQRLKSNHLTSNIAYFAIIKQTI